MVTLKRYFELVSQGSEITWTFNSFTLREGDTLLLKLKEETQTLEFGTDKEIEESVRLLKLLGFTVTEIYR